jgi:hypothetical protein
MAQRNQVAQKYIEQAVRETIDAKCPGYGQSTKDRVFRATMADTIPQDALMLAIQLACNAHDDLLAVCKKLEAFDVRIGKWLAKGNLEPMWYDDLLVVMDEARAVIAQAEARDA